MKTHPQQKIRLELSLALERDDGPAPLLRDRDRLAGAVGRAAGPDQGEGLTGAALHQLQHGFALYAAAAQVGIDPFAAGHRRHQADALLPFFGERRGFGAFRFPDRHCRRFHVQLIAAECGVIVARLSRTAAREGLADGGGVIELVGRVVVCCRDPLHIEDKAVVSLVVRV